MRKLAWGLLLLAAVVVSALAVLHHYLPTLSDAAFQRWAREQGYQRAELESVAWSPLTGLVELGEVRLQLDDGGTPLHIAQASIDVDLAALLHGALVIEVASIRGGSIDVSIGADQQFTVGGLALAAPSGQSGALTLERLHIVDSRIRLDSPYLQAVVGVNDLELIDQRALVIDQIHIENLHANNLHRALTNWREQGATASKPEDAALDANAMRRSLKVNAITVAGGSTIRYQDSVAGIAIDETLIVDAVQVASFDSRKPDQPLTFSLRAHTRRGLNTAWQGEALPLLAQPQLALKGTLDALELPLLSQALEQAIGLRIDRGQAALALNVQLDGKELSGSATLQAKQLQLADQHAVQLSTRSAQIELSVAELLQQQLRVVAATVEGGQLSVVRRGDGVITLAGLPVTGDDGGAEPVLESLRVVDSRLDLVGPGATLAVHVGDLTLADQHIAIDVIELENFAAEFVQTSSGQWRLGATEDMFWGSSAQASPAGSPASEDSGPVWLAGLSLQIGSIEMSGTNSIRYRGQVLGTAIDERLWIDRARVRHLDTRDPAQPLRFELRAHDSSGHSRWWGRAYLFGDRPEVYLRASMDSPHLPLFSTIAARQFDLRIERGRAAAEIDLAMRGKALSGRIDFTMTDLHITSADESVLAVRKAKLAIAVSELLQGQLNIPYLTLDGGRLRIERLDNGAIRLAGLTLGSGSGSGNNQASLAAAASIGSLHVTDSALDLSWPGVSLETHVDRLRFKRGEPVSIDTITLRNLRLGVLHRAEGDWMLTGQGEHTSVAFGFGAQGFDPDAVNPLDGLDLQVRRLQLTGDSVISYRDDSLGVPFVRDMVIERAIIENIDSSQPDTVSSFALVLVTDRYARFALAGTTAAFADPPVADLAGSLQAFSLPQLSPLTDAAHGFAIDTGQLDGTWDIGIRDGAIEGALMVQGNLLTVSATDRDKLKPLEDSLYKGLSLRQMIFLLTDKQGVTALTVPVSGDAHAPTFGLDIDMDAAVDKALKQVTAFVVAPLITATVQAVKKRRKRILAVPFAAGETGLGDNSDALLASAAAQFTADPERMATVCGYAGRRDTRALAKGHSEALEQVLLNLAAQRAWRVKDQLITQHGIAPRRLIDCRASIKQNRRPLVDIR